jgi:hypothetical protein
VLESVRNIDAEPACGDAWCTRVVYPSVRGAMAALGLSAMNLLLVSVGGTPAMDDPAFKACNKGVTVACTVLCSGVLCLVLVTNTWRYLLCCWYDASMLHVTPIADEA